MVWCLHACFQLSLLPLLAKSFVIPSADNCKRSKSFPVAARKVDNANDSSLFTALCVVPPDELWDKIQRARHVSQDSTYLQWPPAIRLFHPFVLPEHISDIALDIARVIEEQNIEPFEVTLNDWTIIPNIEAIEAQLESFGRIYPSYGEDPSSKTDEQEEIDSLIAREEEIGRRRLQKRRAAGLRVSKETKRSEGDARMNRQSPREIRDQQRERFQEFNGPCMICLEPDLASREKLVEIHSVLSDQLFSSFPFSPTSHLFPATHSQTSSNKQPFRPLLPIGDFSTVSSAIEVAKMLKSVWEPLTFTVGDLHLISTESNAEEERDIAGTVPQVTTWNAPLDDRHTSQFGCDAAMMLVGEEIEQDDEVTQMLVDYVVEQGIPGGGDPNSSSDESIDLSEQSENWEDDPEVRELLDWLEDDESWDDGSVIAIGRTFFYEGEMRLYDGMPVTSVVDRKDRGSYGGRISASAKERGSESRFGT